MDDVFVHYAGGLIHEGGTFSEVAQTRRTARRLG
jgi:ABC-2 type transport system ATP-binding protein